MASLDTALSLVKFNVQRMLLRQEERDAIEASFCSAGLHVYPILKWSLFSCSRFVNDQLRACLQHTI